MAINTRHQKAKRKPRAYTQKGRRIVIGPETYAKLAKLAKERRKSIPEMADMLLASRIRSYKELAAGFEKAMRQIMDDDFEQRIAPYLIRLISGKKERNPSN